MRIDFLRRSITVLCITCMANVLANETCEEVPTASFSVGSPLCQFTPVTFTNTSSTTVGQIILYRWQFGDGEESSQENPTHTYDLPNTYTVKLTVLDSEGEFDEFETDIVIQAAPVVDFSINLSDNCLSTTQTFTGSASGTVLSSSWDYGDGFGSSGMNGSRNFTDPGTYQVTFTVVSTANCSNSITKEITIFEEPVAGFTFENVCDGDEVQFNNTSAITNGNLQYSWNFGDGTPVNTLPNPSHTYAMPGDYIVTLTTISTNGMCEDQDSQTVTVNPNPVAGFTAPAVCLGTVTTFTNNSTGVNLSAEWNFGDGNSSADFNATHTYESPGSYIATLLVTSDDGCTNTSQERVDVYADPIPIFFVEDACSDDEVTFNNLTDEEGGFTYTYSWDFGDPLVTTDVSTDENPTYVYTNPGTYLVRLTATYTRSGNMCSAINEQEVVISSLPTSSFTLSPTGGCVGETNDFDASSSIGTITSYLWDYGDGGSSTGITGEHTYSEPGIYDVKLTVISDDGCEDEDTQQITIFAEPEPDFSFDGACDGNEISFTNESTVLGGGTLNYTWNFGDGSPTENTTNPTHTYTQGTYTVTLTVRHNVPAGCEAVIQKEVEVFQDLASSFTVAPECLGDAVTFNNTSTTGAGITYNWNFGDGNTSTQLAPVHTYESPGSYIATLLVSSSDGCTRISERRVDIYEDPAPVFFVEDNCLRNSAQFSNLTNTKGDTYTYSWDFGDPLVTTDISTDQNPNYTYSSAGTYTVRLTATTSNGCTAFYEDEIIIRDHPEVDFVIPDVAFAVSDGCEGVEVELPNTTTIAAGESIASYEWDFGDGSVSQLETGRHTYNSPGVYDVLLTAVSSNGCEDRMTQQVTITGKPAPDFTFGGTCDGNIVSFLNESTVSEGNLNYEWNFGDGSPVSNEINPTHEYVAEGDYTVTLEARNNLGGCSTIVSKEVEIFQELTADFGSASVCFGDEVVFDNRSIGTEVDFLWNFGDGNTSTFFEPSHLYESPGSYIVNLLVTSSDGCSRTTEKRVDVYENPTPVFFFENSCEQEEVLFTNLTNESIGLLSYEWDFGDGNTSTIKEPSHVFEAFGTYTVSLTVTTADDCRSTVSNTIEIYEIPEVDFSVEDVCFGFPSLFVPLTEGEIDSYLWDFGDLTNSTSQSPTKQYLSPGIYNVSLTIFSSSGCSNSITKQAIINELPIADFSASDVCLGEPTIFSNESTDNSTTTTFLWDFGDGATSIAQNPTHTYSESGSYAVDLTITSSEGCTDSSSKLVVVFAPPRANAGQDTTISRGSEVRLQATGGVSYLWSPITGLDNSTIANPTARPLENTVYSVLVTDENGCQSTDEVMVNLREDFKVVASNVFTPDGNGQNDQWVIPNADAFDRVQVKVYDRYGVLVFEDLDYQNDWEGTRGTDILPDGTYYYLITFPGTDVNYSGALTLLRNR